MYEAIFLELFLAIGRFFINPLIYVALLFAIFLGYVRVKRERKYFHRRVLNGWSEFKSVFSVGIVLTLLLSLVTIVGGLTVPVQLLVVVSVVSIICLILFNFHLLSPAVTWAIAFAVLLIMDWKSMSFELLGYTWQGVAFEEGSALTVAIIIGMLLIAEGVLVRKNGEKYASPVVEKTSRGLKSIAYFSKKIWIVPVFFIIPGDAISGYIPWWPLLTIGAEQFGLVLFPVVIGFQQITRRLLPVHFYPMLGRYITILGEVIVLGSLAAYFDLRIGLAVILIALICRFILSVGYKFTERKDVYAVSPSSYGAMIAAVLPGSPAEKMGLRVGEIIKRVNGRNVFTERDLYEALQINAAHCRLEVLDHQMENRLTQYVVHNEDHYQIGVLLVN